MKNIRLNLYRYFIFTFLISWILWSPFYFSTGVNEFFVLPGAWGPTFAAVVLTYLSHGKKGIRKLLRKLLIWKVPIKYYIFSTFCVLFIGIIAVFINKICGNNFPDFNTILEGMGLSEGQVMLAILLLPVFFMINTLIGGPIAEELGWRGYAQEMMQEKYNPNLSGLIIGLIWGLWHLPLIIFLPKAVGHMPVWAYIPLMSAMGVIFSWLYNKTKGSVLIAILFHGGMNFTHGFLGSNIFNDKNLLILHLILIMILAIFLSQENKEPIAGFRK